MTKGFGTDMVRRLEAVDSADARRCSRRCKVLQGVAGLGVLGLFTYIGGWSLGAVFLWALACSTLAYDVWAYLHFRNRPGLSHRQEL